MRTDHLKDCNNALMVTRRTLKTAIEVMKRDLERMQTLDNLLGQMLADPYLGAEDIAFKSALDSLLSKVSPSPYEHTPEAAEAPKPYHGLKKPTKSSEPRHLKAESLPNEGPNEPFTNYTKGEASNG